MESKRNTRLLLPLILLGVLFSQTWASSESESEALRNVRHADLVATTDINSLLDDYFLDDYPESFMEKRASDDVSEEVKPNKRQDDKACTACLASIDKFLKENMESNSASSKAPAATS